MQQVGNSSIKNTEAPLQPDPLLALEACHAAMIRDSEACEQEGFTEWDLVKVIGIESVGIPWKPCHTQHILLRPWHRFVPHSLHVQRVTLLKLHHQ